MPGPPDPVTCPTCGGMNAAGARFCSACGAPVGAVDADVHETGPPEWVSAKPPAGFERNRPMPTRPLEPREWQVLNAVARAPRTTMNRWVGGICSLAALIVCIAYFAGVRYGVEVAVALVAVTALGFVGGLTGFIQGRRARDAMRYGRAIELNGIPQTTRQGALGRSFQLGGFDLVVPRRVSASIKTGEMHGFVIALGLRKEPVPGTLYLQGRPAGLLLEVDGQALSKPEAVLLRWARDKNPIASQAPFSDDRQWWWNGAEWRAIAEYPGPIPLPTQNGNRVSW